MNACVHEYNNQSHTSGVIDKSERHRATEHDQIYIRLKEHHTHARGEMFQ